MTVASPLADRRELARTSPAGLGLATNPEYRLPPHLELIDRTIADAIYKVVQFRYASPEVRRAQEHGPRVMIFTPPRHGKSMTISHFLPTWAIGMFPFLRIAVASYEQALAIGWGRQSRDLMREYGPDFYGTRLAQDPKAAGEWQVVADNLPERGGLKAIGLRSGFTGRGADVLVIDDPIKDAEAAQSDIIRERAKDWWETTARTRVMPGGAVILVQTRWHEDDLAGYLLGLEDSGQGDDWDVISLPALSEGKSTATFPEGVRDLGPDPLNRPEGEALWPGQWSKAFLERTRKGLRPHFWAAIYQQRPAPIAGGMFGRDDFRYWTGTYKGAGKGLIVLHTDTGSKALDISYATIFQTIDTAASEDEDADYTVIATWAKAPWGELVLLDRFRERLEVNRQAPAIIAQYGQHDPAFVGMETVAANAAVGVYKELVRAGLPMRRLVADKDKITRAIPASMRVQEHTVYFPMAAEWRHLWEGELVAFPNATHDDQVDTIAYAARELAKIGVGRARPQVDDVKPVTADLSALDR